ncbi:Malonyl-coa decarboxylase, partial [Globisporangium splendens]
MGLLARANRAFPSVTWGRTARIRVTHGLRVNSVSATVALSLTQVPQGPQYGGRSIGGAVMPNRFFSCASSDNGDCNAEATAVPSSLLQQIDLSHPSAEDRQRLAKMIQEVVKTKANTGDFVPRVVIESLCSKYRTLNIDEKKHFLLILARDLHVDTTAVRRKLQFSLYASMYLLHCEIAEYGGGFDTIQLQQSLAYFHESMSKVQGPHDDALNIDWEHENIERYLRTFRNLRQALSPLYEILRKKGLESSEAAALRSLDVSLKNFLASWFSVGFLNLERVTYERSPGQLLEKIIRYEAVHPVGTIIELKRRLGKGRRCFAFFHPSVPDEPLVFVHVALVKEIASSMQYIREETETMDDEHDAKAAIFYSISSTQKGLQGVDLGNFLIKEVAKALKSEHTQLDTFATLSPMPQFVAWLETHRLSADGSFVHEAHLERLKSVVSTRVSTADSASAVAVVLEALAVENWWEDANLENALKPILLKLGTRYIYQEKKRGKALCPVSNFHIRNGAIFERINWLADPSPKQVEANNENYLLQNTIAIGDQPKQILES